MTINEAIAEQKRYLQHSDEWEHDRLDAALQMSSEALKWVKKYRFADAIYGVILLPGETEE